MVVIYGYLERINAKVSKFYLSNSSYFEVTYFEVSNYIFRGRPLISAPQLKAYKLNKRPGCLLEEIRCSIDNSEIQ